MSARRILVTGASGCLGAWCVRLILDAGDVPIAFDLSDDRHRLELLLTDRELRDLTIVRGDVTSEDSLGAAMDREHVDSVIHLAALQVPFCAANPIAGARVNVVGTVNVFEAVKRRRSVISGLVFASSAAVYGPADISKGSPLPEDALGEPGTHYGVYKQANEATARVYWESDGIASTGLRPYVVFGLGRDQGLTSSPTKAILAAVLGSEYEIGFSGRSQLQYARDVAAAFVGALERSTHGARVVNFGGEATDMADFVRLLESAVPTSVGCIRVRGGGLPFPPAFASSLSEQVAGLVRTPLPEALAATVDGFRKAVTEGKLSAIDLR